MQIQKIDEWNDFLNITFPDDGVAPRVPQWIYLLEDLANPDDRQALVKAVLAHGAIERFLLDEPTVAVPYLLLGVKNGY